MEWSAAVGLYIEFGTLLVERERLRAEMANIEVKGLGANVDAARAAIRRARAAVGQMNESGSKLESTAAEIAAAFEKATSDLLFEAQTLGNSPDASVLSDGQKQPSNGQDTGAPHATQTVDSVRPRAGNA